jgi:hypothetical protein
MPSVHPHVRALRLAGLAAAIAACGGSADARIAPPVSRVEPLASPAGPHSGEPNLAVDARGRVHMTWLERTSDSLHALRYAFLQGTAWSEPRTIAARGDFFVNWADFPSVIATPSGRLVVHWLQRSGPGRYSYDVRYAQSSDDGMTWSEPAVLNRDGLAAEHGFVSLVAAEGDSVDAIWLDGRNTRRPDDTRAMQLATTRIGPDGGLGQEHILDTRICDCCQTSAAVTSRGLVVVYRDRSPDEVRDIAVLRREGNVWTEPGRVHDDGWQIAACPVNGPAVAARGNTVVVAWFTGAQDTARVRLAFSSDAASSFAAPFRVDEGTPAGRVDVELDDAGRAVVSWLERTGGERAEVRVRAVSPTGEMSPAVGVATSSAQRSSGFARMVRRGPHLVIAWTQPGDTARVRVALGRLAGVDE